MKKSIIIVILIGSLIGLIFGQIIFKNYKGKEYLTYVPNPNTCVKPTKEDLDTYANICIELAQYIVDKYKDQ